MENIGIFSSVARDEATESSDIDICIQTKIPNMFMLVHIKEELQNLFHKSDKCIECIMLPSLEETRG